MKTFERCSGISPPHCTWAASRAGGVDAARGGGAGDTNQRVAGLARDGPRGARPHVLRRASCGLRGVRRTSGARRIPLRRRAGELAHLERAAESRDHRSRRADASRRGSRSSIRRSRLQVRSAIRATAAAISWRSAFPFLLRLGRASDASHAVAISERQLGASAAVTPSHRADVHRYAGMVGRSRQATRRVRPIVSARGGARGAPGPAGDRARTQLVSPGREPRASGSNG